MKCVRCGKKVTIENSISYKFTNIHCNKCVFEVMEKYYNNDFIEVIKMIHHGKKLPK